MSRVFRGVFGRKVLFVALFICLCLILHLHLKLSSLEVQSKVSHQAVETVTQEDVLEDETDLGKDVLRMPNIDRAPLNAHTQNLKGFDQSPASVDLSEAREKYQLMLRAIAGVREIWWTIRARLRKMQEKKDVETTPLLEELGHQEKTILADLQRLENLTSYLNYRQQLSIKLSSLLQKRLEYLQNPPNCVSAQKLVCQIGKACGFGCQLHHLMYCFIVAYATRRTLILDSKGWAYSSEHGWSDVFQPLSATCTAADHPVNWGSNHRNMKTVSLPIIESLVPRLLQLPQAVPKDLADELMAFHGHPFVWFAGHFVKYLMRPNAKMQSYIDSKSKGLSIQKPYVGIQVRRTDKINTEAAFHTLAEYMVHVEEWYEYQEVLGNHWKKRVYIATDDPSVVKEAINNYPQYTVYGDSKIARSAQMDTRYSIESLQGIIFDVHTLSESEYIVCTFSSQVCRMAYELMQTKHIDASQKYYSLDDIYYFGGQRGHNVKALYSHDKPNELELKVGDLIGIAGNEKDGSSVGTNRRTGLHKTFPSYKVTDFVVIEDFPTYPEVS